MSSGFYWEYEEVDYDNENEDEVDNDDQDDFENDDQDTSGRRGKREIAKRGLERWLIWREHVFNLMVLPCSFLVNPSCFLTMNPNIPPSLVDK